MRTLRPCDRILLCLCAALTLGAGFAPALAQEPETEAKRLFPARFGNGTAIPRTASPDAAATSRRMSGAILRDIQDKGFSVVPILFAFDKAEILPASGEQITAIVLSLQEQPDLCMRIEGHTDAAGDPVYNLDLSRLRAEAVQAAILAQGIAEKRLQALGWGAERPVADNSARHGRAQNRRVELHRMDCP